MTDQTLQGKRILLTTESLGPVNGVSRTTRSLIEYLKSQGADLVVVAPGQPSPEQRLPAEKPPAATTTTATTGRELRIQGQALPYNPDLTVVYPIHLYDIYKRAFHNAQPDLIYIASPASLGFQILLQTRQLHNPPPVLVNFQTDLSAYAQILLPGPLSRFAVWLLDSVQGYLFRHDSVQTIFYPSSAIESYLVTAAQAPPCRLQRLGRGVDTTLFSPARRDEAYRASIAPNGERILVCVCRLAPEKGFEFLAEVVRRLLLVSRRDRLPPVKMLIVGGNRNPLVERRIRALFRDLQHAVVFTGFLAGESLARAYAVADVFLHCSVTETFGLVVLEAMASGVPVVARDQGGPSDIVLHGRTGFLVGPGDVDAFVVATERVLMDDGSLGLASNARQYALNTTWDAINAAVARRMVSLSGPGMPGMSGMSVSPLLEFISMLVEVVRLRVAVAIVYAMWVIAVMPLLVHGEVLRLRALYGG